MPTFETTTYAAQKPTRANTSRNLAAGAVDGDVEYATFSYTLAGTEAANDIINLCILPSGVVPIPGLSKMVQSATVGTAMTIDVGTANNDDGWGDGIVGLTTDGVVEFAAAAHTAPAWNTPTNLVADTGSGNAVVFATVKTATSLTAGTVLNFILAYKRNK